MTQTHLDNTPANGDFASYVDKLVHQPHAASPVKPHGFHAADVKSRSNGATTEPFKPSAPSHAPLHVPSHVPSHTPDVAQLKAKTDSDDDEEAFAPAEDAWEAKWQPVFMFIRDNRYLLIALALAWFAAVSLLRQVIADYFGMPEIGIGGWWLRWMSARIEILGTFMVIAAVAFVWLLRTLVQRFNALQSLHTENRTSLWMVLGALAALELFIAYGSKLHGLVALFILYYGGASGGLWKLIRLIRHEVIKALNSSR